MLKANSNTNVKNAKEKKVINELKDKYLNLSLKTKLLIKKELNKISNVSIIFYRKYICNFFFFFLIH